MAWGKGGGGGMHRWMKLEALLSWKAGVRIWIGHPQCLFEESSNEVSLNTTLERVIYCFPEWSVLHGLLSFRRQPLGQCLPVTEMALCNTSNSLLITYFLFSSWNFLLFCFPFLYLFLLSFFCFISCPSHRVTTKPHILKRMIDFWSPISFSSRNDAKSDSKTFRSSTHNCVLYLMAGCSE